MDTRQKFKHAIIEQNQDFIQIFTISMGHVDLEGDCFHSGLDTSDKELGAALLRALAASMWLKGDGFGGRDGRALKLYAQWCENITVRYGYKKKRAMYGKMQSCSALQRDGQVEIRPSHHVKLDAWDRGNLTEADNVVIPETSTPEEIGAAIRLALSRCTGNP